MRAYLLCLAAADLTHIGFTLFDIYLAGGMAAVSDVARWNQLVWGNVGITTVLFAWRCAWLAGVGRSQIAYSAAKQD